MASELREFQKRFFDGIFNTEDAVTACNYIFETENKTAQQQYDVYRSSIYGGMTGALAETYPVCKKILGETFFDAMLAHFITSSRSTSADLNQYGQELPEYIETYTPAASMPYLPDVARLEWAWNAVFCGADFKEGNLSALSRLSNDQQMNINFELVENTRLIESRFPAHKIWQVNQDDYTGDQIVDLNQGGVRLLIWRKQLTMHMDILLEEEYFFLSQLKNPIKFSTLCEQVSQKFPQKEVVTILAKSIQQGWVDNFSI